MSRFTRAFERWWRSMVGDRSPLSDEGAEGRDGNPASSTTADLEAALIEVVHERDVSIARASEAEERARLAGDRLESLAGLERRVEVAERRALDAERRLEEISERVNDRGKGPADPPAHDPAPESDPGGSWDPSTDATSASEGLRARLARAAARKRSTRGSD